MPKFFVKPEQIQQDYIKIYGEDVKHITKVLRLNENDIIIICDGCGNDYTVSIEEIQKNEISTKIISKKLSLTEPPIKVILYQGLPKSAKMEYIIQKCTELGIAKIVPVVTKRTVVKLDPKSREHKVERWKKISYEAAKQSNRGIIPSIDYPISFDEAVNEMKNTDLSIICYERAEDLRLKDLLRKHLSAQTISIMIGPEGGFDDEEIEKAQLQGLNIVGLGPRILRTETAGSAVLAMLMYELEGI